MRQLIKQLQKEGIDTVLRQNAQRLVYGVTFVDHKTKSVFNGSGLGKKYTANSIKGRFRLLVETEQKQNYVVTNSITPESLSHILQ